MPELKSKLLGATAAVAAALFVGFAPFAQSHDELFHQLEVTDGYVPSPPHAPGVKEDKAARTEGGQLVGTRAEMTKESKELCVWNEQLRQSDGYNTIQC